MMIFSIPLSLWFVFVASLIAIVALIVQIFSLRKKEQLPVAASSLIFLAFIVGVLLLALFTGTERERTISYPSGNKIIEKMMQNVDALCEGEGCQECNAGAFLSKNWEKNVCFALGKIQKELQHIQDKRPELGGFIEQMAFFRNEIIRGIEAQMENQKEGEELKNQIALLIVLDNLLFQVVRSSLY